MNQTILDENAIDKILGKIGRGMWSQMAWFVKLVNSPDFSSMSDGEQLTWREEFAVMSSGYQPMLQVPSDPVRYPRSDSKMAVLVPTTTQMEKTKDPIAEVIKDLADGRGTSIPMRGCFEISYFVKFMGNPKYFKHPDREPRYLVFRNEAVVGISPLQARLLRLLETSADTRGVHTFADRVRRCPNPDCNRVFLQVKRTSRYCSNRCQSAEGMRSFRGREKERALKVKGKGGPVPYLRGQGIKKKRSSHS
jgi:hypothetical protein